MTALLALRAVSRRYTGLVAVDTVDLTVTAGTIHAVIGPNGAGKTTLFNLITGLTTVSEGQIQFAGQDITALHADRRTRLGLARTFQNIRIFPAMTVLENVLTGLHPRLSASLPAIVLRLPGFRAEERRAAIRARDALALVGLADRAGEAAGALSYGDQRRLEIARAIAPEPRLLLLDEPAAGMNPAETAGLATLVRSLRGTGISVLLVEHDMGFVMDLSDQVSVLNFGKLIAEGGPADIRRDPRVIEAYLGQKVARQLAAHSAVPGPPS